MILKLPATREEVKQAGYVFVYSRPCKRCDRALEFYRTPTGAFAPMESVVIGRVWMMDSHFKSCPFRDEFKKTSPATPSGQGDLFGGKK